MKEWHVKGYAGFNDYDGPSDDNIDIILKMDKSFDKEDVLAALQNKFKDKRVTSFNVAEANTLYYGQSSPQKSLKIIPVYIDRETDESYYLSHHNPILVKKVAKESLGNNIGYTPGYFKMFSDSPDIIIEQFEVFRRKQIESMVEKIREL